MGLFDALPEPSAGTAGRGEERVAAEEPAPREERPSALKTSKPRTRDADAAAGCEESKKKKPRVSFGGGESGVTVTDALARIGKHIGNETKCYKACRLLLKLLEGGQLSRENAPAFFSCLRAGMRDPSLSSLPEHRRVFRKVFLVAEANLDVFSESHRAWIKEYALVAVVRNELYTDDSFVFNKRIKYVRGEFESLGERRKRATARDEGFDPELERWHLDALAHCLDAARDVYKSSPWTRTATDLLAATAYEHVDCFGDHDEVRERVLDAYRSIESMKLERRTQGGNGATAPGSAPTAYEEAVGDWGKREGISKRSGQGGGDSWRQGSANLLG